MRRAQMLVMAALLAAVMSGARAESATNPYLLEPGDRVVITVFGQTELSGEQMVDASGQITMPLAGSIDAADISVEALAQRITRRLADGYLHNPRVSVRVAELRPIYVLGQVKQAGNYPFRYGMTALGAVAIAGGPLVDPQERAVLRAEFLTAQERVNVLEATQFALRARAVRLQALRSGAAELRFPPALTEGRQDPEKARILAGEQEVFSIQRAMQQKQVELLRAQEPQVTAEIVSLAAQMRIEQTQLELISKQLADLSWLARQGLAERVRLLGTQRDRATIQETRARLAVQSAQASERLAEIRMRIQDLHNTYARDFASALEEVNQKLLEGEASLKAAQEILALRRSRLGGDVRVADGSLGPISITRTDTTGTHTIAANADTPLRPGDIVQVGTPTGAASNGTASSSALSPQVAAAASAQVSQHAEGVIQ